MLHHQGHHGQLSNVEREKLVSEGATIQGMVLRNEPSAADHQRSQVCVEVWFNDKQRVEFNEELDSLYQPAPGSPEAQRLTEVRAAQHTHHQDRIPKIQLPLSCGERLTVRYDADHRSKLVIDVPALQKRALHDYIKLVQKQKPQQTTHTDARTGPPWMVPTNCLNCGAPVDQAKASRAPDPRCQFCEQPIPVSPLASS